MITIGAVAIVAGGILELMANDYHGHVKKIRKDAVKNNIDLTFSPVPFSPTTYCVGVHLKF